MPSNYTGSGTIVKKYKGNALFYKLKNNLPLNVITSLFTSNSEKKEEIPQHLEIETQWLSDWNSSSIDLFESINNEEEIDVKFEITSTKYNQTMKHGNTDIGPCRNLNITKISRI